MAGDCASAWGSRTDTGPDASSAVLVSTGDAVDAVATNAAEAALSCELKTAVPARVEGVDTAAASTADVLTLMTEGLSSVEGAGASVLPWLTVVAAVLTIAD